METVSQKAYRKHSVPFTLPSVTQPLSDAVDIVVVGRPESRSFIGGMTIGTVGFSIRRKERGTSFVMVSHEISLRARIADKPPVMKNGQLMDDDTTDAITSCPEEAHAGHRIRGYPI